MHHPFDMRTAIPVPGAAIRQRTRSRDTGPKRHSVTPAWRAANVMVGGISDARAGSGRA